MRYLRTPPPPNLPCQPVGPPSRQPRRGGGSGTGARTPPPPPLPPHKPIFHEPNNEQMRVSRPVKSFMCRRGQERRGSASPGAAGLCPALHLQAPCPQFCRLRDLRHLSQLPGPPPAEGLSNAGPCPCPCLECPRCALWSLLRKCQSCLPLNALGRSGVSLGLHTSQPGHRTDRQERGSGEADTRMEQSSRKVRSSSGNKTAHVGQIRDGGRQRCTPPLV